MIHDTASGSIGRKVGFSVLGVYGLYLILSNRKTRFRSRGALGFLILCFLCWASLSFVWAWSPSLVLRRVIVLINLAIIALATRKVLTPAQFIYLVFSVTGLFLLIGFAAELRYGTFEFFGFHRFAGTTHPNSQGVNCGLFILSGTALLDYVKTQKRLLLVLIGIGFLFLLLTSSRTAFASAMLGIFAYKAMSLETTRKVRVMFASALALLVAATYFGNKFFLVMKTGLLFGRDVESGGAQLTGRVPVFFECLRHLRGREFFGYGYHGFWTPERIEDISRELGWNVPSAHNAYIDILLEVGIVGLFLFVAVTIMSLAWSRRIFLKTGNVGYAFFFALLIAFVVEGVLESIYLAAGFPQYVILTACAYAGFACVDLQEYSNKPLHNTPVEKT